jgi:hypothetical protein
MEQSLSTEQAFGAFLEEVHRFDSPEAYLDWAIKQPETEQAPLPLVRNMAMVVQKRMRGRRPEDTRNAIRKAIRHVIFLYFLLQRIAEWFDRTDSTWLWGIGAFQSYALAVERTARVDSGGAIDFSPLAESRDCFRRFATELAARKLVLERLQTKYFAGRGILWKSQADKLKAQLELMDSIEKEWEQCRAEYRKVLRLRGISQESLKRVPESALFDDFELAIDPTKQIAELVDLARISTLRVMGEDYRALEFIKAKLGA